MSPRVAPHGSAGEAAASALGTVHQAVGPTSPETVTETAAAADVAAVAPTEPTKTPAVNALLCVSTGLELAVLTTWLVRQGSTVPGIDVTVHRWVMKHRTPGSTAIARAVTWGGVTSLALPALVVVGAIAARGGRNYLRRFQTGLVVTVMASVGVFVGLRLNAVVGRNRPPKADWAGAAGGPSFPSGHTSCATLAALAAAWVIAERVRPGWPRILVWVAAGAWAFSIGVSRVWLGVHWPTDVLGGWLFGLTWFAGAVTVVALLRRRSSARKPAQVDLGTA